MKESGQASEIQADLGRSADPDIRIEVDRQGGTRLQMNDQVRRTLARHGIGIWIGTAGQTRKWHPKAGTKDRIRSAGSKGDVAAVLELAAGDSGLLAIGAREAAGAGHAGEAFAICRHAGEDGPKVATAACAGAIESSDPTTLMRLLNTTRPDLEHPVTGYRGSGEPQRLVEIARRRKNLVAVRQLGELKQRRG